MCSKPGKPAYIAAMDTTALGWAVQRTGAGREKAGEPVDPHAGIDFHARRGARVENGQPLATALRHQRRASRRADRPPQASNRHSPIAPPPMPPLVSRIFTRESAEAHLAML